jgi:RND family efflux transporter MFP subunit
MTLRRVLTPLCIVITGIVASAALVSGRPPARATDVEPTLPTVRVLVTRPEPVQLSIRSQGTITPRTEADLVAEVDARVLRVLPSFEPGAFFRQGEVLAELDARDFELALEQARAVLERAAAEAEFARASLARRERLAGQGVASAAILDEARREARVAEARRREAAVEVERAARNLDRTRILAPFDGRVRVQSIDVGQFVSRGTPLGRIYSVDYAEVTLPITDEDLAHLHLPLGVEVEEDEAPVAILRARLAGVEREWAARVVRTEGEIDPRTRMIQVVARVSEPYGVPGDAYRPPLAAGLFVEADILGLQVADATRLPRGAVTERGDAAFVWVADANDRLRQRRVEVVRVDGDTAWVSEGLVPGERVSLSKPLGLREGLAVQPVLADGSLVMRAAGDEPAS